MSRGDGVDDTADVCVTEDGEVVPKDDRERAAVDREMEVEVEANSSRRRRVPAHPDGAGSALAGLPGAGGDTCAILGDEEETAAVKARRAPREPRQEEHRAHGATHIL